MSYLQTPESGIIRWAPWAALLRKQKKMSLQNASQDLPLNKKHQIANGSTKKISRLPTEIPTLERRQQAVVKSSNISNLRSLKKAWRISAKST